MRSHLARLYGKRLGRKNVHASCIDVQGVMLPYYGAVIMGKSSTFRGRRIDSALESAHQPNSLPRPQGSFLVVPCKTGGVRIRGRWHMGVACTSVYTNQQILHSRERYIVGRMDCTGIVAKSSVSAVVVEFPGKVCTDQPSSPQRRICRMKHARNLALRPSIPFLLCPPPGPVAVVTINMNFAHVNDDSGWKSHGRQQVVHRSGGTSALITISTPFQTPTTISSPTTGQASAIYMMDHPWYLHLSLETVSLRCRGDRVVGDTRSTVSSYLHDI